MEVKKIKNKSEFLLSKIRNQEKLAPLSQIELVFRLSMPAIMAQITSIIMQYIDASMVGNLGANQSAAIGLVSSSTWLFGGLCSAVAAGFSVQVAQLIGANKNKDARNILRQAIVVVGGFSLVLVIIGMLLSHPLVGWLKASSEIREDAISYFQIFILSIPALSCNRLAGNMLQCSGNMRLPSILNILMCILDVLFNLFLIFPSRMVSFAGIQFWIWGADLGVTGAALGTALAELVIAILMFYFLCFRSETMRFRKGGTWIPQSECVKKAFKIAVPIGFEHGLMCGAMILTTRIVSPLGTIAIAANSFGITAESLCYMPGYGIADAATTLIGQSLGAKRLKLVKRFSWITVLLGMTVMTITGGIMYFAAPVMMQILTPDMQIQALGIRVLRIEAFAEPLYAASIVVSGALRGAGDTLIPSIMNFGSIWLVRLPLALWLSGKYGLEGVWIAMCIELCFRGVIFLCRLFMKKWGKENTAE